MPFPLIDLTANLTASDLTAKLTRKCFVLTVFSGGRRDSPPAVVHIPLPSPQRAHKGHCSGSLGRKSRGKADLWLLLVEFIASPLELQSKSLLNFKMIERGGKEKSMKYCSNPVGYGPRLTA